jgi:hypothetical protein
MFDSIVARLVIILGICLILCGVILLGYLAIARQEREARAERDKAPKRPPLRRGWDD